MISKSTNGAAPACFVVDHGAYSIKANIGTAAEPRVIPNCVTKAKNLKSRVFIGDQLKDCKDFSGLFYQYAFQKGYLVNWELEKQIWDQMFGQDGFDLMSPNVSLSDSLLVLSEAPFNFNQLRDPAIEVIFEEFGFGKLFCTIPAVYSNIQYNVESNLKKVKSEPQSQSTRKTTKNRTNNDNWVQQQLPPPSCCVVVDSGFSFSHIIPCCNNRAVAEGIRRIDVGGKALTNQFKEVISYRQLMVMEETYVVNTLKEDISFVSKDVIADLDICKRGAVENPYMVDYVLPDFVDINRGMVIKPGDPRPANFTGHEQVLRLCNERFGIPELLFRPSDVGIEQMGIAEALVHSVMSLPEEFHPHMFANIIATGGNCCIPGFFDRLNAEIRSLVPDMYTVNVFQPQDPIAYAWIGERSLATNPALSSILDSGVVTKSDYAENGVRYCTDRIEKFTYGGTVNC